MELPPSDMGLPNRVVVRLSMTGLPRGLVWYAKRTDENEKVETRKVIIAHKRVLRASNPTRPLPVNVDLWIFQEVSPDNSGSRARCKEDTFHYLMSSLLPLRVTMILTDYRHHVKWRA